MGKMPPIVSIVIPVFNEEDCVEILSHTLQRVLAPLGVCYEILFVDDGSTDGTARVIEGIIKDQAEVGMITLSRSYGHQAALSAGLYHARGQAVITMDGDGQHPPELVPELILRWQEGAEVVQAVRVQGTEHFFGRQASRWFYRLFNLMSRTKLYPNTADFRLLDRKILDLLQRFPEHQKFHRGLVADIGVPQVQIPYTAPARYAGTPKYSFMCRLRLAGLAIVSFSAAPLSALVILGLLVCFLAGAYMIFALWMHFIAQQTVPGWSSLIILISFLGGIQILSLGLIGNYIASIYLEAKGRPEFIVRKLRLPGRNNYKNGERCD